MGETTRPEIRGADRTARRGVLRPRLWRVPVAMWLTVTLLLAFGGSAYAYFTSSGQTTGKATVGQVATLTLVTTGVTVTPTLVPGTSGTLYFKVTNPNPEAVTLTTVDTASGNLTATSTRPTTCPASNLQENVTFPHTLTSPISVPAKSAVTTSVAGLVKLTINAPSGCQGNGFTVHLIFSGRTS